MSQHGKRYRHTTSEGARVYLTGNSTVSLDAKIRITLPADIRREYVDGRVCLVPVSGALWGFTPEGHRAFVESCFPDGFNPRKRDDVKLKGLLNGRSKTIDLDSAGRLNLGKLDDAVRERLGFGREVVVVGNDDHFEIYSAEAWNKQQLLISDDEFDSLLFNAD